MEISSSPVSDSLTFYSVSFKIPFICIFHLSKIEDNTDTPGTEKIKILRNNNYGPILENVFVTTFKNYQLNDLSLPRR